MRRTFVPPGRYLISSKGVPTRPQSNSRPKRSSRKEISLGPPFNTSVPQSESPCHQSARTQGRVYRKITGARLPQDHRDAACSYHLPLPALNMKTMSLRSPSSTSRLAAIVFALALGSTALAATTMKPSFGQENYEVSEAILASSAAPVNLTFAG